MLQVRKIGLKVTNLERIGKAVMESEREGVKEEEPELLHKDEIMIKK